MIFSYKWSTNRKNKECAEPKISTKKNELHQERLYTTPANSLPTIKKTIFVFKFVKVKNFFCILSQGTVFTTKEINKQLHQPERIIISAAKIPIPETHSTFRNPVKETKQP